MRRVLSILSGTGLLMLLLAAHCFVLPEALAEADGTIVKLDGSKQAGAIRWLNSAKKYEIVKSGATSEILPSDVADVIVPKPLGLDKLAGMVNAGQGTAAIPELEKIVEKYLMLQWDLPATALLLKACKETKSTKGLDWGKKVADNREGTSLGQTPDFMSAYMDALIVAGRGSEVDKVIQAMIQSGKNESVAVAYLKRGDLFVARGNHKDALIDGYLRTVLLYSSVKEIQPEALFKTVKSFEELKQATNAEKWRKKLLAEYPSDPYTAKLRSGI